MSSALACVGLAVSDGSEFERMLKSVYPDVRGIGLFDSVHFGRWQDDSGTTLILGLHDGEIVDFATTYTGSSGGLLADCRLIYESVAFATVTGTDGQQLTAMAFEAEHLATGDHPQVPVPGNIISGTVVLSAAIDSPLLNTAQA